MIVVCNTSPLTNLAAIGQFALLHQLYGRLHIAEGVWEELNARGQHWPGRDEVATADWIERHTVQNQALVTALRRDLDRGEAVPTERTARRGTRSSHGSRFGQRPAE